jgi:hypothetical protein
MPFFNLSIYLNLILPSFNICSTSELDNTAFIRVF